MLELLRRIGHGGLSWLATLGRAGYLLGRVLVGRFRIRHAWPLLLKQLYMVGVLSIAIIGVALAVSKRISYPALINTFPNSSSCRRSGCWWLRPHE